MKNLKPDKHIFDIAFRESEVLYSLDEDEGLMLVKFYNKYKDVPGYEVSEFEMLKNVIKACPYGYIETFFDCIENKIVQH